MGKAAFARLLLLVWKKSIKSVRMPLIAVHVLICLPERRNTLPRRSRLRRNASHWMYLTVWWLQGRGLWQSSGKMKEAPIKIWPGLQTRLTLFAISGTGNLGEEINIFRLAPILGGCLSGKGMG